jgi:ribosomal protein L7Ae-like RNA K-turn-binding protein
MRPGALGMLGLAARARSLLIGTGAVRQGLQSDRVAAVLIAADRSDRTIDKVERLARARGVPVVAGPPAEELGRQLGRSAVQAVGLTDGAMARGFLAKLAEDGRRTAGG